MFGFRVSPVLDRLHIGLNSSYRRIMTCLEILDESRCPTLRDIEDVVEHENLAIDVRTGTDANYRYVERVGDHLPDFIRDALKQYDIRTRILQALRRLQHVLCLVRLAPLHLEAANLVN